jgi:YVTN family beta-propeller protein
MSRAIVVVVVGVALLAACSRAPAIPTGPRLFVTNEMGGDVAVVDLASRTVASRIPVGKRPRGIHTSADGNTVYVALSGSPMAGPGVDESKLPPADKRFDGIGVIDAKEGRLVRSLPGGSDPEEFAISADG